MASNMHIGGYNPGHYPTARMGAHKPGQITLDLTTGTTLRVDFTPLGKRVETIIYPDGTADRTISGGGLNQPRTFRMRGTGLAHWVSDTVQP